MILVGSSRHPYTTDGSTCYHTYNASRIPEYPLTTSSHQEPDATLEEDRIAEIMKNVAAGTKRQAYVPKVPEALRLPWFLMGLLQEHRVDLARFAVQTHDGVHASPWYPAKTSTRFPLLCLPPSFPHVMTKSKDGEVMVERILLGDATLRCTKTGSTLELPPRLGPVVLQTFPVPARTILDHPVLEGFEAISGEGWTIRLSKAATVEIVPPREVAHGAWSDRVGMVEDAPAGPFTGLNGTEHAHVADMFEPTMIPTDAVPTEAVGAKIAVVRRLTPGIEASEVVMTITVPYDPSSKSDFHRLRGVEGASWHSNEREWHVLARQGDLPAIAEVLSSNHRLVSVTHDGVEILLENAESVRKRRDKAANQHDIEATARIRNVVSTTVGTIPQETVEEIRREARSGLVGTMAMNDLAAAQAWIKLLSDLAKNEDVEHVDSMRFYELLFVGYEMAALIRQQEDTTS
jgi:hypothetical protein